jgi:hypothetical protein
MLRRDQFIKKIAKLNSGDYLKNKVLELEKFVDVELAKKENIIAMINSNTQGSVVGTVETVESTEETYAVHNDPNVLGENGEIGGKKIWSDFMFYTNGGHATNQPWSSITLTNDFQFDGILNISLPEGTNKNVAKMLADKYMDTTVVSKKAIGGCWGEGNVIVRLDKNTNRLTMTFKMFPVPSTFMPTYYATATETVSCGVDKTGTPQTATSTKFSKISKQDAMNLAKADAQAKATAQLVCVDKKSDVFYATATETAYCPAGTEGEAKTATASGEGATQNDANANAKTNAQNAASAQLTCVNVWNSEKTATVSCPAGTTGSPSTATGYGKSYTSQADADQKATTDATTKASQNLSCQSSGCTSYWQPKYTSLGCFTGMMKDVNGCQTDRGATEIEWQEYYFEHDTRGKSCPYMIN